MSYEGHAYMELKQWQKKMMRNPSVMNKISKGLQTKMNSLIPEKLHKAITTAIRQMIKAVLFGAKFTSGKPAMMFSLHQTEEQVERIIDKYKKTAAAEGGITGAGGILMGFADFPLFLSIKIKMLFEIATLYGFDVRDYKERVFLLHIFELAFSSQQHRRQVYFKVAGWEQYAKELPEDMNQFDWRNFQQEYRDYIDLAKLAQLIPGIGAVVGLVVNYKLTNHLGNTAMNAFRMRLFSSKL